MKNKEEYITKEYFNKTLDQKLELALTEFKHHTTELSNGFTQSLEGFGDQINALDEKITRVDKRVADMDFKLTSIGRDVFYIKEIIKDKTDKKDVLDLKKRVIKLESTKTP